MRPRRPPATLALLLLALALAPRAAAGAGGSLFERSLAEAWEGRRGAGSIVALHRAADLASQAPSGEPLLILLTRLAAAPDAQPEVKAHARELLRAQLQARGRWKEAEALTAAQGFVRSWLVLGPYSDESKLGWDTPFDPERALDFAGRYFGKEEHEISWRRAPQGRGDELVRLDAFLAPAEKVVGYAAAFVRVEQDTPCVLRGGYNEAHKIWVDGEQVGGARRYNGRAFDHFADPCTLRRGWNLILVKVCNQEASWNFTLRLTDSRGATLRGWRATSDPGEPKERLSAILAKDGSPAGGAAPYDPGAELARGAKVGDPRAKLLWGEYLYRARTFDRSEQRDTQILREAAEALKSDPWAFVLLGDSEPDHNLQRDAWTKATALDPADAGALRRLGEYYLRRNMPLVGLRYLDRALAASPGDLAVLCARDRARLRFLTDGLAAADLRVLAARFPESDCVQEAYLESLRALGEGDRRASVLAAFVLRHQTLEGPQFELLQLYRSAGKGKEAEALYADFIARVPFNREAVRGEATWLLALNRPADAKAALAPALGWAPDWPEGQALSADIALALGDREAALAGYQRALELKPQAEEWKQKVAYLRPQESPFYGAYKVERADLPAPGPSDREQPLVVLVDNTVVQVQEYGLSSRYTQRVLQLLQAGAARQMQYYPIPFDPDRQEVRVLDACVLKSDGAKVHADSFVTDALSDPQVRLYYRNRNLVLHFPGLQPGDRLWVEYVVSDVADRNDYGRYFGDLELFSENAPVLLKRYTLQLPAALELHVRQERLDVRPIVVSRPDRKIYSWTQREVPRAQQEPGMPGFTESSPYLHVSTFADREAMGAWYAGFIQDQWEVTPAVRDQVASLVKGLSGDAEKVRAVHTWVVQQTRYVGLEFGVHGYKPYKARQIFERRFGDCKDKALLLCAMLRAAGVDACMVLVRTRNLGALADTPASLAVFNHCIAYVPSLDLYLDGTAEYSGLHELPWQDRGVEVLLVCADGKARKATTPLDQVEDNRYDVAYTLSLAPGAADAEFAAEVGFAGQECAWVRRSYQDPDKRRELFEKGLSSNFPGTRVGKVACGDLSDLNRSVRFALEGRLGGVARADGPGRASVPTWLGNLDMAEQYGRLASRAFPLELAYPWRQRYAVTYRVPAGYAVEAPPELRFDTPFGAFSRAVTRSEGALTVVTEVTLSTRRVEPDRYAAFREFCIRVDQAVSERVRVLPAGGAP